MSKKAKLITIIVLVISILAAGGVVVYMLNGHYVSIKGQHLNKYEYSTGGGMTGGYYDQSVCRYDDTHALVSIKKAEWHSQDPDVEEYFVDPAVMDELEGVIRKNRMNFWNRKKFTDMFVSDGESSSYSFSFDEGYISFSSQIYPINYSKKLDEFDDVLEKHINNADKLPGLVDPRKDMEENYELTENAVEMYVYYYCRNELGVRINNGTEEQLEMPDRCKIVNADTDEVICENDDEYSTTIWPNSRDEMTFSVDKRLDAGNYKLIVGETEVPFEIR